MPFIEGLEEQKAALTRVKQNLNEIEKINESISNLKTYIDTAKEKEYKIECEFVFEDESLKRIKIPVQLVDNAFLFEALNKHRETIANKIKEDSSKFRISLSPQELSLLG